MDSASGAGSRLEESSADSMTTRSESRSHENPIGRYAVIATAERPSVSSRQDFPTNFTNASALMKPPRSSSFPSASTRSRAGMPRIP